MSNNVSPDESGAEHTHAVATVTASGDTTVITPTSGKKLKVYWLSAIADPDESDSPLIKIGFGPSTSITDEKYRLYALAKRQLIVGDTDEKLIVNLSAASSVAVTVIYDEVDP